MKEDRLEPLKDRTAIAARYPLFLPDHFFGVRLVSVLDRRAPKLLLQAQLEMEPAVGIEPTTDGLQNRTYLSLP